MRIGCFGVIPAIVRYDKKISHGAKLLYAELSASSDHTGKVELDVPGFANVLECDSRTLYRYANQLVSRGHIEKIEKSIFRLPMGFNIPSKGIVEKPPIPDDLKVFILEFLRRFEEGLSTSLEKKELYFETILERLHTFSQNEMMKALENRIAFVAGSEWHQKEENRPNATDITLLIKDNTAVLRWLNMKNEKSIVELKPFNYT